MRCLRTIDLFPGDPHRHYFSKVVRPACRWIITALVAGVVALVVYLGVM